MESRNTTTGIRILFRHANWFCALGLALLMHASAGGLFKTPLLVQRSTSRPVQRIVYLPPPSGENANLAQLWAPVLFALPSRGGFSESLPREGRRTLPPLTAPAPEPPFFAPPERLVLAVAPAEYSYLGASFSDLLESAPQPDAPLIPMLLTSPSRPVQSSANGWRFLRVEGLNPSDLAEPVWPEIPSGSGPLEFTLYLDFAEEQRPRTLILEPEGDPLSPDDLRVFRQWRLRPGAPPQRGWLALRYDPPGVPDATP